MQIMYSSLVDYYLHSALQILASSYICNILYTVASADFIKNGIGIREML